MKGEIFNSSSFTDTTTVIKVAFLCFKQFRSLAIQIFLSVAASQQTDLGELMVVTNFLTIL